MKQYFFKLLFLTVLSKTLLSCGDANTSTSTKVEETKTYETTVATSEPISKTLQLNGELMAHEKASIVSKVNGYVKKVSVDIGQQVYKGQTLAIIDAPEMNYQIAEANSKTKVVQSRLEATKSSYNRLLEASFTPGAVAANELDQAKSQMDADMQSYNAAMAASRTTVQ